MADCEFDDLADLMFIDPTLNSEDYGDIQSNLRQPVEVSRSREWL